MKRLLGLTLLAILLFVSGDRLLRDSSSFLAHGSSPPFEALDKQRGVAWTASPNPITRDDFSTLVEAHINWITQTPFGWQRDYDSPAIELKTTGVYWGETDAGLALTTDLTQQLGIHTLLKPHIWLTDPRSGRWRTDIAMASEADWQSWFQDYRTFILHYAQFAEAHHIEALCIGTELQTTATQREQDWRQLIAEIRSVFHGSLTYAANWFEAFEDIQFWDALDFIGIQAYFPLTNQTQPSVADLKKGWRPYIEAIARVQQRYDKPIIFTEIGYRSTEVAAIEPWEWPDSSERNPSEAATQAGLQTQANCYEAFFELFWHQDWFAGVFWWKWFPEIKRDQSTVGVGFTPQNKPAESVLSRWYASPSPHS